MSPVTGDKSKTKDKQKSIAILKFTDQHFWLTNLYNGFKTKFEQNQTKLRPLERLLTQSQF